MMSLIEKKCMGRKKSLNDQISTWLKRFLPLDSHANVKVNIGVEFILNLLITKKHGAQRLIYISMLKLSALESTIY